MLPSTSSDRGGDAHLHPSPRLVMTTLLLVSLPIEIIFLATVHAFGWLDLPFIFMLFQVIFFALTVCHDLASFIAQVYTNFIFLFRCCLLFALLFQVIISLYLSQILTNFLWKRNLDPDMYALPVHSAFVDLVGQLLLVACYEVASSLGAKVATNNVS